MLPKRKQKDNTEDIKKEIARDRVDKPAIEPAPTAPEQPELTEAQRYVAQFLASTEPYRDLEALQVLSSIEDQLRALNDQLTELVKLEREA